MPERFQKALVVFIITAKAAKEILKICIVAFLLCTCGYITVQQLLIFYLILFGGISLNAVAPAISSIPSEWVGLKPAMILFNKFADENIAAINFLEADELEEALQKYNQAAAIITKYFSKPPDLLEQYPEISEFFCEANLEINHVQQVYNLKKKQIIQNEATYFQYVQQERIKRDLKYGVPPQDNFNCPPKYPIRSTTKLGKKENARGIYYFADERVGVEVDWCFSSPEEAEADNFRRSRRTPPKQQPK